ncbi:MAG: hypothetical protein KKH68_04140 [Proteobacteria bacterium]|nr:hypothetical protein [Pseudomonadota bacterium]
MKPIYFPFTYVCGPVVEALSACFKQTVVYQPSRYNVPPEMQEYFETGRLDIRIPVAGDEDNIAATLKDYRNWVNLHQKGAIDFLKFMRDKIPFFDETSVSQIQADIKKKSSPDRLQKASEALFHARLFLHAAQEFDRQNNELNRDLQKFDEMELDFIKDLKGEDTALDLETAGSKRFTVNDPGLYMAAERLTAWTHVMQHDHQTSGLYITTSRSVFDELIDRVPEAEAVIGFDAIPVYGETIAPIARWQDGFIKYLKRLSLDTWPASGEDIMGPPAAKGVGNVVSIKLYIVAGKTPHDLFAGWVENDSFRTGIDTNGVNYKNTLIGLIGF